MTDGSDRTNATTEVTEALRAADRGDLQRALHHLGEAFLQDPGCVQAHFTLHDLVSVFGVPSLLELVPVEDHMSAQAVVVRASLLQISGELSGAVTLVTELALHIPSVPVAQLARAWVANDPAALGMLDPLVAVRCGARWSARWPAGVEDPMHRLALEPFLDMLGALLTANPQHAMAHWSASGVARRLGRHDLAVAWAEWAVHVAPDGNALLMLAYAYTDAGRVTDAEETFREVLARDPGQHLVRVDLAELLCRAGRLDEGRVELDRVLSADPDHTRAHAAALRWP